MPQTVSFTERLPILTDRPFMGYGYSVALCLLALTLRLALDGVFPPGYPYVTFFPAVILSAFLFGLRPGILAATLCGFFAWYFFINPRHSLELPTTAIVALGFYLGVVVVDIALVHWMQIANARLRDEREKVGMLAERSDLLFRELQHRVGNNLQMISAVLSLQMRGLKEPLARRALSEAVARLEVIGNLQRQLYRGDGAVLPLDTFVADLVRQTMRSGGRPGIEYAVTAETGLVLPPDSALPMALVLSEAIANALEHGFASREKGRIAVRLYREAELIALHVEDDGAGLPDNFDPEQSESLGLQISRILSRQMDAHYSLANGESGTVMRLLLPARQFATA